MMDESTILSKALKAAKKSLKKQDDNTMKLKALAKAVAEQLDDDHTTHKTVKKWIMKSDKFLVDGKKVSLYKKRSSENKKEEDQQPSKKARKGDTVSLAGVEQWRNDNKIVIMHAKDDEEGQKESKSIQQDSVYFPFTSFDDCESLIVPSLIRQCTVANGFQKPSPIQAQSWPILMHHKRDVVGIAETGKWCHK
jgi:hypothetical protein